jgi:hypothetical protein
VRGGCGVSALIAFGADEKPLLMAAVFFACRFICRAERLTMAVAFNVAVSIQLPVERAVPAMLEAEKVPLL